MKYASKRAGLPLFLTTLLLLALLTSACSPAIEEAVNNAVQAATGSQQSGESTGAQSSDGKPEGNSANQGISGGSAGASQGGKPEGNTTSQGDSGNSGTQSQGDSSSGGNSGGTTVQSDILDFTLSPNYGEDDLASGFAPDPYSFGMVSGGDVDASYLGGDGCYGYVTSAPDFRVYWSGNSSRLRFFFEGNGDTTLIINDPSGNWYCNDDSYGGLDPTVSLNNPAQGQYDIWVGSLSSGEYIDGVLNITELDLSPGSQANNQGQSSGNAGTDMLDFTLSPNYGEQDLQAGFTPDPYTLGMTSGGQVDASYLGLSDCYGYATSAPDFRIYWSGSSSRLRFFFEGNGDTTLIINTPSGQWQCNDDSYNSYNPTVDVSSPQSGQYDIWVGSYSSSDFVSGTLYLTELDLAPGDQNANSGNGPAPGDGTGLDYTLSPNYGEVDLQSGFTPDPYTLDITSGGVADASYLGDGCYGYATAAPDFRVYWSGNSSRLRFFFESSGDTTLIINGPSGNWYCNDDSYGGLNPTVTLNNPNQGQYDIWVGSLNSDDYISGTLNITELDLTP